MQDLARSLAQARGEIKRLRGDMKKFKAQEIHRMQVVEDIVKNKQITIAQVEQIKVGNFEPLAKKSKVLKMEIAPERSPTTPIGYVISPFLTKSGTPHQPGQLETTSRIKLSQGSTGKEVKQRWMPKDALEGLEEYSHCWVIFHFHLNDPESNGKKSKVAPPRGGGTKVGIFASRAPYRPSPIGLSLLEIDKVDHNNGELVVKNCDLVHETPVLDIKPYIPDYDQPEEGKQVTIAGWLKEKNLKPSDIRGVGFTNRAESQFEELYNTTSYQSAVDLKLAVSITLLCGFSYTTCVASKNKRKSYYEPYDVEK